MADKAKHAFGALERVDENIANGVLDAYDILFVKDANGKPYVGWVDKEGNKVVVDDSAELAELGNQIATKANAEDVKTLEGQIATKANATEVDEKIKTASADSVSAANAYTNKIVEAAMDEHLTKKFEVDDVPVGTLVDYKETEIRVMCPADAVFTKQAVGTGGNPNGYYMTFKTYAPSDDAVGYIEHLNGESDKEILTTFSVDEFGRRYQPTWLELARYDESTDTWTYWGKNSTENKYIGWDYQIDFFNADGVMIASDSVRISLSNEQCHYTIKPYYVGDMMKTANAYTDAQIEAKIAEMSAIEVIEF